MCLNTYVVAISNCESAGRRSRDFRRLRVVAKKDEFNGRAMHVRSPIENSVREPWQIFVVGISI